MEVEYVQLVIGHQVDVAFDICNAEEVAGHIQHGASPGKPGIVSHCPSSHLPWDGLQRSIFNNRRQHLPNGLDAPKQAGWFIGYDSDQVGRHHQLVSLIAQRWVTPHCGQINVPIRGRAGRR